MATAKEQKKCTSNCGCEFKGAVTKADSKTDSQKAVGTSGTKKWDAGLVPQYKELRKASEEEYDLGEKYNINPRPRGAMDKERTFLEQFTTLPRNKASRLKYLRQCASLLDALDIVEGRVPDTGPDDEDD